jgi:iron complex transport system substrate-binding protein
MRKASALMAPVALGGLILIGLVCVAFAGADQSGGVKPVPAASAIGAPASAPRRIVSMNPCVDAVLMDIAAPHQVAAISHYSHDPRASSIPMAQAMRYPAVSDEAEDIIAANPDLVIAGPHVAPQTILALQRVGVALMRVPVPQSLRENAAQITTIAARIGRVRAGERLNQRINAAVNAATISGVRPIPALIWQSSGLVPGTGTLADELLNRAGFHNVSADLGLTQWDQLPLEDLLMHPPKVLFAGIANMQTGNGDANRMLGHPALRMGAKQIHIVDYPSSLLYCGGPVIIRAAAHLSRERSKMMGTGT